MQSGDSVDCPHCGEKTIVKTKNRMDGFAIVGSCLVCALCGAELGGADLTPDADYGCFCRNCIHFIEHPFRTLCGRDGRTADPMGECGHFKRKEYLC